MIETQNLGFSNIPESVPGTHQYLSNVYEVPCTRHRTWPWLCILFCCLIVWAVLRILVKQCGFGSLLAVLFPALTNVPSSVSTTTIQSTKQLEPLPSFFERLPWTILFSKHTINTIWILVNLRLPTNTSFLVRLQRYMFSQQTYIPGAVHLQRSTTTYSSFLKKSLSWNILCLNVFNIVFSNLTPHQAKSAKQIFRYMQIMS